MKLLVVLLSIIITNASPQNQRLLTSAVWTPQSTGAVEQTNTASLSSRALPISSIETATGCAGPNTECVPYFNCDKQIQTDNSGLIDIVVSDIGPCPGSLDVCCAKANQNTGPPQTPTLTSEQCGYRNANGVGFRISGEKDSEAQFAEFPWMVAVLQKKSQSDGEKNLYVCGGSLIHPRVVMTAAHCIADKPNNILKVRMGEWDTQTTSEPLSYQDRDIVEVNIHPDFKKGGLANDIALLYLDSPVTIAENVKTICIPPAGENFEFKTCFATGWGKDRFGGAGRYQAILKKVSLPVIPQDTCQNQLRSTRLSQFFELHDSFICAGGERGKDTCTGDGGSPLVCPISGSSNRYYQAGIVAWGIACGEGEIPGVYARVSKFADWIDTNLRTMGLDDSSYKI